MKTDDVENELTIQACPDAAFSSEEQAHIGAVVKNDPVKFNWGNPTPPSVMDEIQSPPFSSFTLGVPAEYVTYAATTFARLAVGTDETEITPDPSETSTLDAVSVANFEYAIAADELTSAFTSVAALMVPDETLTNPVLALKF
jgi:hypothetical protein